MRLSSSSATALTVCWTVSITLWQTAVRYWAANASCKEVSARLKVSRRTLQDYRNNGIIAYYQLGGKILYKESDIERMLAANYREAFR